MRAESTHGDEWEGAIRQARREEKKFEEKPRYSRCVDLAALLPDLAVGAGEHVDAAHLLHGHGKGGVEAGGGGEVGHELRGGGVLRQRGVGGQRALALAHPGVEPAVEPGRRAAVQAHGGGRRRRVGARRHERAGVGGVQQRVDAGGVPLVPARGDAGAAGHADGVRPRQRHQVRQVEPATGEARQQAAEPREGRRQRPQRVGRQRRRPAVPPPRLHLPQRRPELVRHRVARRQRHDVRARHHPRARLLHLRLDRVDRLVPAHRQVRRRRLLALRVVQQDRRVAALHGIGIGMGAADGRCSV
uniref:Uncharacterized protein n=1 Tax=Zea mays TaxID=4577 RepID=C0PIC2_MAIZE|nr:unknown [Zea mays]